MTSQLLQSLHSLVVAAGEPQMSFSLVHMWQSMGPFAKVIVAILAAMSAYSLGVMAERMNAYRQANKASRRYSEQLRDLLPARKYGDAVSLAKTLRSGHLPRVLGLAIEEWERGLEARLKARTDGVGEFDVVAAVNRSIERSSTRTIADLRRGLGALATIGSTAPFVGLLGTVAGIITAFQAMAATGSGGLGSVSAGIAEALVTTAFGLLVAIPAVMTFNYLSHRAEDIEVDITDSANELVDFFIKNAPSGAASAR
jgi:biopolymer transport protein ExbB/TolQ